MNATTHLSCTCGKVALEVSGDPIIVAECCCNSCREAGSKFAGLPGAPVFRTGYGTTPYVLMRKDRVHFSSGTEQLREFRLKPDAPTRRVVAACCNTPVFVEFQGGHWLSLYASLWPDTVRPRVDLRTMAGDLPDPLILPADAPNLKGQSGGFFARLCGHGSRWAFAHRRSPPRASCASSFDGHGHVGCGVNHAAISKA